MEPSAAASAGPQSSSSAASNASGHRVHALMSSDQAPWRLRGGSSARRYRSIGPARCRTSRRPSASCATRLLVMPRAVSRAFACRAPAFGCRGRIVKVQSRNVPATARTLPKPATPRVSGGASPEAPPASPAASRRSAPVMLPSSAVHSIRRISLTMPSGDGPGPAASPRRAATVSATRPRKSNRAALSSMAVREKVENSAFHAAAAPLTAGDFPGHAADSAMSSGKARKSGMAARSLAFQPGNRPAEHEVRKSLRWRAPTVQATTSKSCGPRAGSYRNDPAESREVLQNSPDRKNSATATAPPSRSEGGQARHARTAASIHFRLKSRSGASPSPHSPCCSQLESRTVASTARRWVRSLPEPGAGASASASRHAVNVSSRCVHLAPIGAVERESSSSLESAASVSRASSPRTACSRSRTAGRPPSPAAAAATSASRWDAAPIRSRKSPAPGVHRRSQSGRSTRPRTLPSSVPRNARRTSGASSRGASRTSAALRASRVAKARKARSIARRDGRFSTSLKPSRTIMSQRRSAPLIPGHQRLSEGTPPSRSPQVATAAPCTSSAGSPRGADPPRSPCITRATYRAAFSGWRASVAASPSRQRPRCPHAVQQARPSTARAPASRARAW